jgi:hypothetical protein
MKSGVMSANAVRNEALAIDESVLPGVPFHVGHQRDGALIADPSVIICC